MVDMADPVKTSAVYPSQMRDHWWWRPGQRPGRRFYTFHITFNRDTVAEGFDAMQQMVRSYQTHLAKLPNLDLVPPQWLHLTTQGVGYTDEVDETDAQKITEAVRRHCARLAPLAVTIGPAQLDPEGVPLPVTPVEPLAHLRAEIRAGIADVWGADRVPEPIEGFHPHVTLAYSNAAGPAAPHAELLAGLEPMSVEVTIRASQLIILGRDTHLYSWQPYVTVPLGDG
jgi:2'-5' RNA ligase